MGRLLYELRLAGADEQTAALLHRDPAAHVSLDDPAAMADLLHALRMARAHEQAAALLRRDPAGRASLDNPRGVGRLLAGLREAGAGEQATLLVGRLPGAGMFQLFLKQEGNKDRFRFGREADGSPAEPWAWDDLE